MPSIRGRPTKFGCPATPIGLTLPDDVWAWLRSIHRDPSRAIVSLFEASQAREVQNVPRAHVELVQLSGERALIIIDPSALRAIKGASTIPLAGGRALITLDPGRTVANFEAAVADRLLRVPSGTAEHVELSWLSASLRRWRRVDGFRFHLRGIIIVERAASRHHIQPLPQVRQRSRTIRTLSQEAIRPPLTFPVQRFVALAGNSVVPKRRLP